MSQDNVMRQKIQEIIKNAGDRELQLIYAFSYSLVKED